MSAEQPTPLETEVSAFENAIGLYPVFHNVVNRLTLIDLHKMCKVNKMFSQTFLPMYIKMSDVDVRLGKYFKSPRSVRAMLQHTGSVVVGDFPTQYFAGKQSGNSFQIMANQESFANQQLVRKWKLLLETEGYEVNRDICLPGKYRVSALSPKMNHADCQHMKTQRTDGMSVELKIFFAVGKVAVIEVPEDQPGDVFQQTSFMYMTNDTAVAVTYPKGNESETFFTLTHGLTPANCHKKTSTTRHKIRMPTSRLDTTFAADSMQQQARVDVDFREKGKSTISTVVTKQNDRPVEFFVSLSYDRDDGIVNRHIY